jgi:peptide/nickel transport system ATP-binding protein
MNPLLLEVRRLSMGFQDRNILRPVLKDISFSLSPRETLSIVGESGSGKSVSALSILKLIPSPPAIYTSGEILFHTDNTSVDLLKISNESLRAIRGKSISMIFQEPMSSLNPVFTCGDQVAEAIQLHQKVSKKEAREHTLHWFREVQLPRAEKLLDAYPHEISGGQKQRVMIAMAMSCQPRVLIADEPTTALDVTVQKTIIDLMCTFQKRNNMGMLFITHDLGVIAELADTVAVMYRGKVVEQGAVLDIFSNPKHPYTKSLLACRPPLDFRVKRLPVVSDFMTRESNGELKEVIQAPQDVLKSMVITQEERALNLQKIFQGSKILELKNVSTWFPSQKTLLGKVLNYTKAVDDVSFDLYEGETLGLVGESGCGKTTLGRSILKLADGVRGEILYWGKNIVEMKEVEFRKYRKDMQIIFQDPYSSLNPRLTVGHAIHEPMRIHEILNSDEARRSRVIELLKRVGLEEKHYNRYPHEFSGGQRQRICIARALALNPKFIICDESVSALDVSVQAQVLNLLNELKEEFKFTYIFISHDLSVVKFMSDRMIVMQQGKIVEMGEADQVYNNPQSAYTRNLIHAIPKGNVENIKSSLVQRGKLTLNA